MPVITAEVLALPKEKKEKFVKELTRITSEITTVPEDKIIVFVKENSPDNVSSGGVLLSNM